MRRIVGAVLATALAGAALGQSFTIRRPAEGSTVRETVSVLIPAGSIPNGGYIGVVVNGKFIEAAMPALEGENYVYKLDTKARQIPDGDLDIEIVLYLNFSERVEVVNRSSVRVKLDNYTSIKIPQDGLQLRYKFKKGQELKYRHTMTQSVGTVSQAASQLGSRVGEVPVETETSRMLYAIDNVYPTGEALVRIMGLPEPGKNYAYLTVTGETEAKKYYDFEMHPLYMRVDATGREIWGAIPPYFPLDGTSGESSRFDLYSLFPLPVLPTKALFPGDTWQAAQLFSQIDLDKAAETENLTVPLVSRGTFLGVEWEQGIPCAKFNMAVDAGPREMGNAVNLNNQAGEATRVTLEGTVWFALDRGVIVKSDINFLQESMVTIGTQPAGGSAGTSGGGISSAGTGAASPPGGATGGGFNVGMIRPGDFVFDPHVDADGNYKFFRQRGGPGVAGQGGGPAAAGAGGADQGSSFGNRTGGGSGGTQRMLLRVRVRLSTQLEK